MVTNHKSRGFCKDVEVHEEVQRKMSTFLPRLEGYSVNEYSAEDGGLKTRPCYERWMDGALPGWSRSAKNAACSIEVLLVCGGAASRSGR